MRLLSILVFVFTAASLRAQDFQQWNEVDLAYSATRFAVTVPFVARTDPATPNPQLAATGFLLDLPAGLHFTGTIGYLGVDLPYSSGWVNVPLIAATALVHAHRLTLADRNRFEKLIGYSTQPWRYRNRGLIDLPLAAGSYHFFVDDEFFFNLSNGTWNQNRFQAGAGARLLPHLFLDLYYLQKNVSGAAKVTYVLGTNLRISIGDGKHKPIQRMP